MITVKNLHKSFGKTEVLKGIDYHVEKGEKIVVVGPSGSGKSTLAKIVMGLLEPSCGDVWLNGVPLCEIDKSSLYDVITYQDQSASFFNGTIKENIVLGEQLPENTWRQIITASCLDGLLDKLPEGEFTVASPDASQGGRHLSYLMKLRPPWIRRMRRQLKNRSFRWKIPAYCKLHIGLLKRICGNMIPFLF